MSNVNDNNLDDLMRRAAERYPLRTDSADWEKLATDLEKDPSLILPPVDAEDRRRRRRFFWLFFLLPLAGAGYYAWHGAGRSSTLAQSTLEKTAHSGAGAGKSQQADGTGSQVEGKESLIADGTGSQPEGKGSQQADKKESQQVEGTASRQADGKNMPPNGGVGAKAVPVNENAQTDRRTEPSDRKNASEPSTAVVKNIGKSQNIGTTQKPGKTQRNGLDHQPMNIEETTNTAGSNATPEGDATPENMRIAGSRVERAPTKGNVLVNIPVRSNVAPLTKPTQKDKIKLQKPKPSFYVGILGSPDLSTIKFQSVKNMGSNFGVLLGYSFNSRWAIETGAYYDRKKYYTDGEYFSKKNVRALYNADLKTVDGICYMWEIPVNVRYNFSTGEKMKWFATTGLSNYLMSKESYSFTGTDSWGRPFNGTWPYKTPYKYWFSIVNFSAGFEQRIGKIGNLRLEPYVRIPMSGIGTGNLSIMSAGLNIGITRKIW